MIFRNGAGPAGRALSALAALFLLPLAACDDPFGPQVWNATPDTLQIWSASRSGLIGKPAAFDLTMVPVQPVLIEQTGATQNWDVVLIDQGGQLALAPSSFFAGQGTRAGIAPRGPGSLADLLRAPKDSAAYTREPVPLRVGDLYVIRTRVGVCVDGFTSGVRYAKITPVEIDEQEGTVRFAVVRNPYCDNRDLVPPEDD